MAEREDGASAGCVQKTYLKICQLFFVAAAGAMLTALSFGSATAQVWSGTASSDWTNPANWAPATLPTFAIISKSSPNAAVLGVSGPATATITTLTMNGTGGSGVPTTLTIQNGSTLTSTGATFTVGSSLNETAILTVTGAGSQLTAAAQIFLGNSGAGILNIENGGRVTDLAGVRFGSAAIGSGTLNISGGGILQTAFLIRGLGSAQVNFDNGILQVSASNANFFQNLTVPQLNIGAGGATIDTNGFSIGGPGFSGVGGLTKIGAGTLTLSDTSTYAGETDIEAGTLALSGTGSISNSSRVVANSVFDISGLTNGGTSIQSLAGGGNVTLGANTLTITNANDLFAGVISGTGGLTVNGGTQTLSGANTYTGATTVSGGTLRAGAANAFSAASAFGVGAGGTLDLNGFNQTVASLSNAGTVHMGSTPGTVLTVNGIYTGTGGTLLFNTVLGGDSSATDRLVVNGSTAGTTSVKVTNAGGLGAPTTEGIKIIDVLGASSGTFSLVGDYAFHGQPAIVAGAYAYTLQQNGVSTPTDGDWYLRSSLVSPPAGAPAGPIYQPGVPLYENYAQVLLGLNALPTLQERVGNRYWGGSDATARSGGTTGSPVWIRIEGQHGDMQPQTTAASTYSANQLKVQMGVDGPVWESSAGKLVLGVTAQYGLVDANVASFYGNGQIQTDGYSIGPTLTWYGNDGFYVDGQAQATKYTSDLNSALVGSIATKNDGLGYAFSIEGGKRIGIGSGWSIVPQAQLSYSAVDFTTFADRFGALVSLDNANSLVGRAGLQVNYQQTWRDAEGQLTSADIYGIGNLDYEFLNGPAVTVSGTNLLNSIDRLWSSIGAGGTYSWHGGKYSLYGQISYNTSLTNIGKSDSVSGTGGFRVVW
jgi:outer membrane autotransporter protein